MTKTQNPPADGPGSDPISHRQGLVVFVENKDRVSAFYQQTLSLQVEISDDMHDVLRGGGYEVVVHAIPAQYRSAGDPSAPVSPVLPREDSYMKPTFVVSDLEAVRRAAERTFGYLKPTDGAWRFRGHIVLDGWDPEGNIVQFKQAE